MRCPKCKKGNFDIVKYRPKENKFLTATSKEKALFACNKCDYTEVI